MSPHPTLQKIACQQIMVEDASVFSVQWTDLPTTLAKVISAEELLQRYLGYINKFSLTLIRPATVENGVEFRLIGTRLSLISFLPPVCAEGVAILRICGGVLVQPRQCDRGELRFGVERRPDSVRVSLQLSDFCPLLLGSRRPSRVTISTEVFDTSCEPPLPVTGWVPGR